MEELILDPSVDDLIYVSEDDQQAEDWWSSQWEIALTELL